MTMNMVAAGPAAPPEGPRAAWYSRAHQQTRRRNPATMVRAYVLISASPGKAIDVSRNLKGQDGIVSVDAITGEYDAIAQVQAPDIAGIGQLIVEKIQRQDGVFKTITCLAVE